MQLHHLVSKDSIFGSQFKQEIFLFEVAGYATADTESGSIVSGARSNHSRVTGTSISGK